MTKTPGGNYSHITSMIAFIMREAVPQSPYTSRNSSKEVSMEDDLSGPKHVDIRKKLWMVELLDRSCPSS